VEGTCYENHDEKEAGGYSGESVHCDNETKDSTSSYGFVHLSDFLVSKKMVEKILESVQITYLPVYCQFWGILSQMTPSPEMRLERNIRTYVKRRV